MKPPIAVLVDGDQLGPEGMPGLLDELGRTWLVTERICVRNWRSTRDQQAWREFSAAHSFRLIQRDPVAAGKNASDIELAVTAMDLLAAGHRAFCLVSGDMDFTPLVDRLRRGGCHVDWVRPADMAGRSRAPKKGTRRGKAATTVQAAPTPEPAQRPRQQAAPRASGTRRGGAAKATKQAGAVSGQGSGAKAGGSSAGKAKQGTASGQAGGAKPAARPDVAKLATGPDVAGFGRVVRRIIAELRRDGEHERGWVSVNRLGSKLTEAGTTKDDFGFPKRRPLWAALQEADFEVEQMETGQYRVTLG